MKNKKHLEKMFRSCACLLLVMIDVLVRSIFYEKKRSLSLSLSHSQTWALNGPTPRIPLERGVGSRYGPGHIFRPV